MHTELEKKYDSQRRALKSIGRIVAGAMDESPKETRKVYPFVCRKCHKSTTTTNQEISQEGVCAACRRVKKGLF